MRLNKKRVLLVTLVVMIVIVMATYLANRSKLQNLPNEVLSQPIYELVVVKSASNEKTITQSKEIVRLLQLLETNRWEPKNLGVKCMPDYTLVLSQERSIGIMCINQNIGYSSIKYKNRNYYYTMPLDTYSIVSNALEELFN